MPLDFTDGFSYGDYTYGDNLESFRDSPSIENQSSDSTSYSGSHAGVGRLYRRQLELRGVIQADDHQLLRDSIDEFLLAHTPGYPRRFIAYTDRFLWAQPEGEIQREHTNARIFPWVATFRCADPFYYSANAISVDLTQASLGDFSTPRTATVVVSGTAFATPVLTVVIDSHASGAVSITNSTTGEELEFEPDANGTYTLHCGPNCTTTEATNRASRYRLFKSGVDKTALCSSLDMITLAVGSNSIIVSGAACASVNLTWHSRYI